MDKAMEEGAAKVSNQLEEVHGSVKEARDDVVKVWMDLDESDGANYQGGTVNMDNENQKRREDVNDVETLEPPVNCWLCNFNQNLQMSLFLVLFLLGARC